jgi:hypothetical protein
METNHRKNILPTVLLASLILTFSLSLGAKNSFEWEEEKRSRFEDPFTRANTGESGSLRGSITPPDNPEEEDVPIAAGESVPIGDALGWLTLAGLGYGTIKKHSNFILNKKKSC